MTTIDIPFDGATLTVANICLGTSSSELRFQCHLCKDSFLAPNDLIDHIRTLHYKDEEEKEEEFLRLMEPIVEIKEVPEPKISVPQGPGRGRRRRLEEAEKDEFIADEECFFQCTRCQKAFRFPGDLAKHVRAHVELRPFTCALCRHAFTHIGSLNTHLRIHSGHKPFKCGDCTKCFVQASSLLVHQRSHLHKVRTHEVDVERFCCSQCAASFRTELQLAEHQPIHELEAALYQCSVCSLQFRKSGELVQHAKTHIGMKPFKCRICAKFFTQPGSLNAHLRVHSGEKSFACKFCEKRFVQASSLSTHTKKCKQSGAILKNGSHLAVKSKSTIIVQIE